MITFSNHQNRTLLAKVRSDMCGFTLMTCFSGFNEFVPQNIFTQELLALLGMMNLYLVACIFLDLMIVTVTGTFSNLLLVFSWRRKVS